MNSDNDEMVATLLEEEVDAVAAVVDDDEHMKVMSCILGMYAWDLKTLRVGLRPWQHNKQMQRLKGYCILYADYFADDPLHGDVVFLHRFRMNQKLFMKIVLVGKEFNT
jgi:hypothetical protein